jgi:hypothetical protein
MEKVMIFKVVEEVKTSRQGALLLFLTPIVQEIFMKN